MAQYRITRGNGPKATHETVSGLRALENALLLAGVPKWRITTGDLDRGITHMVNRVQYRWVRIGWTLPTWPATTARVLASIAPQEKRVEVPLHFRQSHDTCAEYRATDGQMCSASFWAHHPTVGWCWAVDVAGRRFVALRPEGSSWVEVDEPSQDG